MHIVLFTPTTYSAVALILYTTYTMSIYSVAVLLTFAVLFNVAYECHVLCSTQESYMQSLQHITCSQICYCCGLRYGCCSSFCPVGFSVYIYTSIAIL